ncbi:MAG: TMEM165/GDT1 family protein [Bacteriovorax sp.]|nr:TMEM165/GDT1 family protein [Bacteriovorax sp.]
MLSLKIIFNSFLLVSLTEMGDKTQLLAFVLATRFKKPWTIFAGIFVATVLNHLLAATAGVWVANTVSPLILKRILASIFLIFAVWILIPDKEEGLSETSTWGPFLTTVVTFFLAEMGDKTQLATVTLAAKYHNIILVTVGTTIGMMITDGLAVFFGDKMTKYIPMKWVHIAAAILYIVFALGILFS